MLSLALSLASSIQDSGPVDGRIVAASLFKNGYAVVVREAPLVRGQAFVRPPAGSVLGTLWVSAGKGVSLVGVKRELVQTKAERNAGSFDEVLSANVGKPVLIRVETGSKEGQTTYDGTLLSAEGQILILQRGEGQTVVLQKSAVVQILGPTSSFSTKVPTVSSEQALRITGKGDGTVYWVCLQRGMTWAPAYSLDVTDEKTLHLTAKATILNDLADLDNVAVNLVTGFPNMKFLNLLDPLTSGQSVNDFVQSLAYVTTDADFKRDMMTQNAAKGGFGPGGGMEPTGAGETLEDLFLYKQPAVTLKTGERGYYIVLQGSAAYKSVYTVAIPDWTGSPQPVRNEIDQESGLDVWHTLKFVNATGQPLTTGPAITVKSGEAMGQDIMNYVAAGAEASVRVTKSLDIRAECVEEETQRERGFLKVENRATYDRVTVKGTLEVTNHKAKEVQMEVTKTATGDVTDPGGATVRKVPAGLRQVNPVSVLTWKPRLKAGEKATLVYQVQVLVPSSGY